MVELAINIVSFVVVAAAFTVGAAIVLPLVGALGLAISRIPSALANWVDRACGRAK